MKICLFGVSGIVLGKHNIKDPRLDQTHEFVEADKKTYAQADVVGEKEMITSDAIVTTRAALSDLLMKDLDAVETRLGRDPSEAEKAVLQKLADVLMSEKPVSAIEPYAMIRPRWRWNAANAPPVTTIRRPT